MSRRSAKPAIAQPTVTATSQTSRFHTDTLTTLSTEIDLKQVNISLGQHDLLMDVDLRLKAGVHYALVGRNGEGKSTLLKAIADKIIPGIPENLRILLIDQVTENQSVLLHGEEGIQSIELSVAQAVVQSNKYRERLLRDRSILLGALETPWQNGQNAVAIATAKIQLARSKETLDLANKIATKRSGARGIQARKELKQAEKGYQESLVALEDAPNEVEKPETLEKANNMLMEVQDALESIDADATESQARSILRGLGFSEDQLDAKFSTLSGGWRSRCALASGLLQKPNLLLLDEPNNYCDLPAVIWLQNYITNLPGSTVVVISHDRDFLDAITEELIVLRNKTLTYFDGNPSQHARFTSNQRKWLTRMKESQDKKQEAMEKTIADAVKLGKRTGDEGKLRMAKSRQKKLDERWGMEVSAKGTRFKLNRDLMGYHATSRGSIEVGELDKSIKIHFPNPESLRFPGALISVAGLSYRYSPKSPYIIENISITIHPGSRVAFVGRNGQGKSTLVKLLVGTIPSTKVERHPRLKIGYYDQHSVEELSRDGVKDKSVIAYFMEAAQEKFQMTPDEGTARAVVGAFGLGPRALSSIQSLSGGQKVRLALSLIAYSTPNLLVLDEVSTHLDLDTIQALVRALRAYSGAILLVSHDRYLVRCLVEGAPLVPRDESGEEEEEAEEESDNDGEGKVGSVYIVSKRFRALEGGMDEYVRIVEKKFKGKHGVS
ncbi:hypothetical protein M407DRAFT_15356 [Tulasnella calospora MUT 4182]|uniref:ABC transporter domain-containing protein n=1 Tax=Tulasnella calospora MUT 4182 TaxID=1051891 RepID=A0A0C3QFC1_9AGAM|nr:hypothetical protein M407DRAFT_15356 [Tulasnella calospora MUT 4182]